ncbi:MAG TPA: S-layer homology domain-containing protein [Thermoanaerobaculia bacterium]|jgi:hypothetical protein
MRISRSGRPLLLGTLALCAVLAGGATRVVQDQCGPFTDVTPAFCPYILELYYLGVTAGTSATTFSPDDPLTRGQGAVFVAKGLNQALARSSHRAALAQWWTTTPHDDLGLGVTTVGDFPAFAASDGQDIWVTNEGSGTISRVRASDGKLVETWTGADTAYGILVAMGRVFVGSAKQSGALYMIDPSQPPGPVTTIVPNVGDLPGGLAFDGSRLWVANFSPNTGSVAIVTPAATPPWSVINVTTGFLNPSGMVFDGSNIWVTDVGHASIDRLDSAGGILQQVTLGGWPTQPVFDGANIWVPNYADSKVSVVRAATGEIVATLVGNGVSFPWTAAFDGQRVLVTNKAGSSVSLWNAADLTPLGSFSTSQEPLGACSDGVNFWIVLQASDQLVRF